MGEQSSPCRWGVLRGMVSVFGRLNLSFLFEPDTSEEVPEDIIQKYFGDEVLAELQVGSSHDGMDLDPPVTASRDREVYFRPGDFQDGEVHWETIHANAPPVDDRTELEPCVCGQGCLRCQARQIIISRPSASIGRMIPINPWHGEGMLQRQGTGWGIAVTVVSVYRKISGILQQIRLRRTVSMEITPATTPCTPGTPRRAFIPNLRSPSGYIGIRQRKDKWVSEIRISGTNEKVWLGSYDTEKGAALAYDAGLHHCNSKRVKHFNFSSSPRLLGPQANLEYLSSVDRRLKVRMMAEAHARNYSTRHIE